MDKAFKNKTAIGATFRKALKEVEPNLNIPDEFADAVAAPINASLEELRAENKKLVERLDARDAKEKDDKDEREIRSDIDAAVKKYGLDDEGKQKVIERMAAKRSLDAEAAAAWFKSSLPKPESIRDTGIAPRMADIKDVFGQADGDEADLALLHGKNPMDYFDRVASRIIHEESQAA